MSNRCALAIALFLLAQPTFGGDGPTDPGTKAILAEHGLVQSGRYFVIAAEEPIRVKIANLKPFMAALQNTWGYWEAIHQNENEFQYLTDLQIGMRAKISDADLQISRISARNATERYFVQQARDVRAGLDYQLRRINSEIELRRKRLATDGHKAKVEKKFNEAREAFVQAIDEAQPLWDKVKEEYKALSEDSSVMNAIKAHAEFTKAPIKLGPSKKLQDEVNRVIKYEQLYSPETAGSKAVPVLDFNKGNGKKGKGRR